MEHKMVDPAKIVEDLHRRSQIKYKGKLEYTFEAGEIINIREKYDIDILSEEPQEQWTEAFKHFSGLMKWNICGKVLVSLFRGKSTKMNVERSLPMEKFRINEERK